MNRLSKLYDVTKQLEKVLEAQDASSDREVVIAEVNELIEQRDTNLKDIYPPFTEEEQKSGKEIVVLNEKIKKAMNQLFEELKADMREVKQQKESNRKYIHPYRNVKSTDGMFLDSKQ